MRTEQTFADWRGLIADRSQAKRYFDLTHALDLVYGVDSDGRALMALLTDEPVEVEGLSKDVHVHSTPARTAATSRPGRLSRRTCLTPSSRSAVTSSSARPTSPIGTAHFRRCWRASPSGSCCFSQGGSAT